MKRSTGIGREDYSKRHRSERERDLGRCEIEPATRPSRDENGREYRRERDRDREPNGNSPSRSMSRDTDRARVRRDREQNENSPTQSIPGERTRGGGRQENGSSPTQSMSGERTRGRGRGDNGNSPSRSMSRDRNRTRGRDREQNENSPTQSMSGERTRGRGRGGGRGRGRGLGRGRGARRDQGDREQQRLDLVVSRPMVESPGGGIFSKKGNPGGAQAVTLVGNFFRVLGRPNWCFNQYRVDFFPEEWDTRQKKVLLKQHAPFLGAYVFDGGSLYRTGLIDPDPLILYSTREGDGALIEVKLRLVGQLSPTDVMYLQLLNIIVRKCMEMMGLEEINRNFYDHTIGIDIPAHHLTLWPGYKTSMRQYESDILLNVDLTHKVLRMDNCLNIMRNFRHNGDEAEYRRRVKHHLVGSIVLTIYNRKTYRVDDIEWDTTPISTFNQGGSTITFVDYFRTRYNINILDGRQPMLMSRPKKKDYHRGSTGPIMLIPELCRMTGMSEDMRNNFALMRAVSQYIQTDPGTRAEKLGDFMKRIERTVGVQEELGRWGLSFQNQLVEFQGRTLQKCEIGLGGGKREKPNQSSEWSNALRDQPMWAVTPLKKWVMLVPSQNVQIVDKLVSTMQRIGIQMGFQISEPIAKRRLTDINPRDYAKAVDAVMNEHGNGLQMIFIILPHHVTDIYAAVKKRACLEFGVPSQCFVAKNAGEQRLLSVCSKLVVQMSAKLGGEPWAIPNPLKDHNMVIGFNVHHCGKRRGNSVGAMIATTSPTTQGKFFSCVSFHSTRENLSENMGNDFRKCLMAYKKINGQLPKRIIFYRDGVGEGQLQYVYETELKNLLGIQEELYSAGGHDLPKFGFIVINRRINTRMITKEGNRYVNPPPGTVADDVITLPERYDFFLISQYSRQGTVSPVSYNVLFDRLGLSPDQLQRYTYKLCHLYFNWSGTVTVPAVCQYAHKLAYLTGTSLGAESNGRLSNLLYYL